MARERYLVCNEYGVYCFRYTLPKWYLAKHLNSKKTIHISLLTKDFDVAKLRVRQLSLHTRSILSKIKNERPNNMADKDISTLIRAYRNHIEADPNEQDGVYWGSDKFEEIIEYLRERLGIIDRHGLLKFVNADLGNVEELFDRAAAKDARVKNDEIASVLGEKSVAAETTVSKPATSSNKRIKLSELLKSYAEEKEASIGVKTLEQTKGHIEFLISVVGDIEVAQFNEDALRNYRAALKKRKVKRRGELVGIKHLTMNEHIESCKLVFEHAKGLHNVSLTNFFDSPTVKFVHKKQDSDKRLPFSADDLQRMFSSDIFTSGSYKHPYQYWAPLIALYTGSRANEIAQLRVNDIVEKDGIHCISHNMETPDKKLKTADERFVPIHPQLIALGFLEFVELFKNKKFQWTVDAENHRLFKGLTLDEKRGGYMKELSRWFNGEFRKRTNTFTGFKHAVGIKADKGTLKDFHSFRHTFSTALEDAKVADNISYQLTGHSDGKNQLGGAGRGYRHGASVGVLYEELCRLDYGRVLEEVKPFFELNGEKKCRNKTKGKNVK